MVAVQTIDEERWIRFARRSMAIAFCAGLLLAIGSSGAIVVGRTLGGTPRFAFASSVLVSGVCSLIFGITLRSHYATLIFGAAIARLRAVVLLGPQLAGAALGIAFTHLLLRLVGHASWLAEGPQQFVNDAVASIGLALMMRAWGCRSLCLGALAIGLGILVMYSMTSSLWHLDQPPIPFEVGVQQLVVTQVLCGAVALLVTRLVVSQPKDGELE